MSSELPQTLKPQVIPALTGLAGILFHHHGPDSLLETVVRLALGAGPPGAAGAWLHLEDPLGRFPGTDPVAEIACGAEADLGEGPCLSACKDCRPIVLDSVDDEDGSHWPRWTRAVAPKGLGSTLAVPLVAGHQAVGAVCLYAAAPLAFDAEDALGLQLFGALAGTLIVNFQTFLRARRLGEQLTEALGTRDLIGTAKGILMEREAIDEDAAFALLRAASQRSNLKLREIAHALVRAENPAAPRPGR